ncbi:hypothetical protein B0H14DRAFT_2578094 [Mycena olivaceomarginata]|nr:hypothetical protein B0H14DRAFT_2578094 [Mycena olivaceomarginata]
MEDNAPSNNASTQSPDEEKREVGGEGNIGTERSPYSKKKVDPMGTQFRYSGDLTQGRNGAAEARILSSEGRKSWICLPAWYKWEEEREVGGERNIGTERSPYSKKKTDGNETILALKIEDRHMRDLRSRIASSTSPRTGVADIDPGDLSGAGKESSSDPGGCRKRDAERGRMIGDRPAQIQDNQEFGGRHYFRATPAAGDSSEDFRVPSSDSVPRMRKRTCGVMHLVSPVIKGGGKGVNKRRQSRYEGEGVKEGGFRYEEVLGEQGGRSREGRRWEERKGGRERLLRVGRGRVTRKWLRCRESKGEKKKGMGREDVKEEDMKANANAKWNGRQGQNRTPIALAVPAAAEGSQTSLSGGSVEPAEAVDLTPLVGYGWMRLGEREPEKKNALERSGQRRLVVDQGGRRKEEEGVERRGMGRAEGLGQRMHSFSSPRCPEFHLQNQCVKDTVLPAYRSVRGLFSAADVTASVESLGPRAQVEAEFAFESRVGHSRQILQEL